MKTLKQGERYGKLVFLEDYKVELNGKMVSVGLGKFLCDCGNEYIGNMSSIGFQRKKYKKRFKSFDDAVAWRKEMEEKLFASFLEKLV